MSYFVNNTLWRRKRGGAVSFDTLSGGKVERVESTLSVFYGTYGYSIECKLFHNIISSFVDLQIFSKLILSMGYCRLDSSN